MLIYFSLRLAVWLKLASLSRLALNWYLFSLVGAGITDICHLVQFNILGWAARHDAYMEGKQQLAGVTNLLPYGWIPGIILKLSDSSAVTFTC